MTSPEVSLTDPAILIDPYPALSWLRENDPIHWAADARAWVVTRHADVLSALRDPRLSANRVQVLAAQMLGGGDTTPVKDFLRTNADMMLMRDGAEHHRLRALGNRGFTPTALTAWSPRVHKVIAELLDGAGADGTMDVVADLAEPMPATVIAEMFGIPASDHRRFRIWADDMARFFGGTVRDPMADGLAANHAAISLESYFRALHDERKARPGDDLMSLFLAGEEIGRLSVQEVVCQCMMILIAGHVTTIDQLANSVYALLRHEGAWASLVAEPGTARAVVEESIRFDPAVSLIMRVATEAINMGGKTIQPGDLVLVALAAANRDPAVVSDPDRFDPSRTPNKHVGFGAAHHQCIGMNLARIELEAALVALAKRFPRMRLDPERLPIRKCESLTFRGFARLPVRVD